MNLIEAASAGFNLLFSSEHLKAALLVSLLSVWVLVAVFYYLNRYTRRKYFTIWTAAWLFYALWLTLTYCLQLRHESPWLFILKQWCIGVTAAFLLWGSLRFLGHRVRQTLMTGFVTFLFVWSYLTTRYLEGKLRFQFPLFAIIGLASMVVAGNFYYYRRRRQFLGASLLIVGFSIWGIYLALYPLFQYDDNLVAVGFLISAVLQILIAVSMIILVLEQIRFLNQRRASKQIQNYKTQSVTFRAKANESEERYRYLFEQASEAIVITNATDLQILELNQTAERLFDVRQEQGRNLSLTSFFQIDVLAKKRPKTGEDWFDVLRRSKSLSVTRKDGRSVAVEATAAPIYFNNTKGYQFYFREITDRAVLEQQLRQSEKLSALGKMISGVAHELNNPLAVVKGYLEVILAHHPDLPERTRDDLVKVARESNRAARLVQNFLAFARQQPSTRQLVDLNELICGVTELRKFDLSLSKTDLVLELDPTLPKTTASPDQVQQLFVNLLSNAMEAMTQAETHRIKISTTHAGDCIRVLVEDTGPGIPEDLRIRIFEPFFTTKGHEKGTGLGLSIAHSIMAEHKGKIQYQPSSIGGAGFLLVFPVVASSSTSTYSTSTDVILASAETFGPRPEKILIVDDEAAIVTMLGEMLDILGFRATLCYSPVEALEKIETENFDLVLSDIRMPEMSGMELYRRAVQQSLEMSQRFIFLTGDVVNEETQAFLKDVGSPYIAKPFHLATLQEAVSTALRVNVPLLA